MEQRPASITPAWLRVAMPGKAWQGMQELHRRALGGTTGLSSAAAALSPAQAFATLSNATAASLAQIAVTSVDAATRMVASLCDHVEANRRFDGLEGPFLSALEAALRSGHTPETERAARLWRLHGRPPQLAGGATTTTVLSAREDRVALVTAERLDRSLGPLPADAAGITAALSRLFRDDVLTVISLEGEVAPPTPAAGLLDASRAMVAFAGAVAGHAELRRRLVSPDPHDSGSGPQVLDRVLDALKRTVDGMMPSPTGPAGPGPALAKGMAVVVDISVLGGAAPAADAAPGDGGTPPAIRPHPTILAPRPDDTFDFGSLPFWSGLSTTPTFVVGGPGIDGLAVLMGETWTWLASLPELTTDGRLGAPGFLAAANLSLPVHPPAPAHPGTPERVAGPGGGEQPSGGLVMSRGRRGSLTTPMYLSFVVYPPTWPLTGGDPEAEPPTLPGPGSHALEASALTLLEETVRARRLSPDIDVFTALDELTR